MIRASGYGCIRKAQIFTPTHALPELGVAGLFLECLYQGQWGAYPLFNILERKVHPV